jgi:hypothetical protein
MKPFVDTYAGWTSSEATVLAACSVILVITIIAIVLMTMLVRSLRKHSTPQLNAHIARKVSKQFTSHSRNFMDSYNKEKDRY